MKCICGSTEHYPVGYKDDRLVVSCQKCGLWYVHEVPDDYLEMYKGNWYQNDHQINIGHVSYKERYWHDYRIAKVRLEKIKHFQQDGRLLDVGCSNGAFVHCAFASGFDAFGIDLASSTNNIERCSSGDISYGRPSYWDIVTLHDVIEHFLDPKSEIGNLWRILGNEGLLVIQTPDFGCEAFRTEGIDWKHVRPIEHIYMMSSVYLSDLLKSQGFRIIEVENPIPGQCTIYACKL